MKIRRFPLMMGVALACSAAAAHAQSAPATAPAAAPVQATKIDDIEVAQDGDTVSILVKFSGQPSAASAHADGKDLKLAVDGVTLSNLTLTPPAGSLVTHVTAANGQITLSGAALSSPDVVIYRHAVLVKAKLADPADIGGASLMAGSVVAAAPAALAKAPIPVAPAPLPTPPSPKPISAAPPLAAIPIAPPAPAPDPAVAIIPAPQPPPEHPPTPPAPDDDLHSAPTPAAPAAALTTASIAGIDAARCTAATEELAKDSWALGAMGDVALCLIDQGKADEARARLDQLGAITPQDWRVSLGRAVLASQGGDTKAANDLFLAASRGAPNEGARRALVSRIVKEASVSPEAIVAEPVAAAESAHAPEPDLQLPLPK
jgi:hypothetical protein